PGQHLAALDPVPDAVVDRIGDGLEDRLDHPDRQRQPPVARQGEGHQDRHDQVHGTVARNLESQLPRRVDQDANHYRAMRPFAARFKAIPLIWTIARAWGCGSPPTGAIRGPQNGGSKWRYAKALPSMTFCSNPVRPRSCPLMSMSRPS